MVSILCCLNIMEKLPQGGPLHRAAGEAAVVVLVAEDSPALMLLTLDEGVSRPPVGHREN